MSKLNVTIIKWKLRNPYMDGAKSILNHVKFIILVQETKSAKTNKTWIWDLNPSCWFFSGELCNLSVRLPVEQVYWRGFYYFYVKTICSSLNGFMFYGVRKSRLYRKCIWYTSASKEHWTCKCKVLSCSHLSYIYGNLNANVHGAHIPLSLNRVSLVTWELVSW